MQKVRPYHNPGVILLDRAVHICKIASEVMVTFYNNFQVNMSKDKHVFRFCLNQQPDNKIDFEHYQMDWTRINQSVLCFS